MSDDECAQIETFSELPKAPAYFAIQAPTLVSVESAPNADLTSSQWSLLLTLVTTDDEDVAFFATAVSSRITNNDDEYLKNCAADRKSTAFVVDGDPKTWARRASVPTLVAIFAGPQRKSPTIAPVVDCTFGT